MLEKILADWMQRNAAGYRAECDDNWYAVATMTADFLADHAERFPEIEDDPDDIVRSAAKKAVFS